MWLAIWLILTLSVLLGIIWVVSATVGLPDSEWFFGSIFAIVAVLAGVSTYFIGERLNTVFGSPHTALAIEEKGHYDTKGAAASRMLVIRGVDDEASLSLAAGSIGSRLSYLVLVGAIPAIVTMTMFVSYLSFVIKLPSAVFGILMFSSFFGALIFFFVPGVFKSFFGREFLVNALVCDISVDSAPDTVGQVEVITLRPVEVVRKNFSIPTDPQRFGWDPNFMGMPFSKPSWHLRHGIYNHPDCVDEIVRWLRRVT